MKNAWWLLAGAAAFIGYKLYNTASNVSYRVTAISIDKQNTNLVNSTLKVTLRVSNPGDQSLPFTRFTGSLTNNGTQIALIDVNQPVTIAARSLTEIVFPVQVSNLSVLAQLLDMLIRKTTPMVTIQGVITAGPVPFPITETLPVTPEQAGLGNVPASAAQITGGLYCLAEY